MRSERTKKMATLAMLSALAFIVMMFIRIPVVLWLSYEPKDVVIAMAGFIYGPMSALIMSAILALLEMVTVSDTGPFGAIMNFISSVTFSCTAAIIYRRWRTLPGAAVGLLAGIVITVPIMLLWNYLIVPLYVLHVTRADVMAILIPVFLPFNLLKYGLSAALTMLLYKSLRLALQKSNLLPQSHDANTSIAGKKATAGVVIVSAFVVLTCIMLILAWRGII
jgi:riboflavin transporter FmnP